MKENRTLLSLLPSVVFAQENVNVTLKSLKKNQKNSLWNGSQKLVRR